MMIPVFSLRGLYEYDRTLFAGLTLPAGADRTAFIDHILFEYGEFASIYTDPNFLKDAISNWSKINAYSLERLYKTTTLEYNPIWNKDGIIEETRTPDLHYHSEAGGHTTTESSISADNMAAYAPDTRSVTTPGTTSDSDETGEEKTVRKETGNIGVTTTQAMIKEEREIANFSFYKAAAKIFADDFLILIY